MSNTSINIKTVQNTARLQQITIHIAKLPSEINPDVIFDTQTTSITHLTAKSNNTKQHYYLCKSDLKATEFIKEKESKLALTKLFDMAAQDDP